MIFKGFSMNQIIRSFKEVESPILRKHTTEITDFKKTKIKLLTNKDQKSYQNLKTCYIFT